MKCYLVIDAKDNIAFASVGYRREIDKAIRDYTAVSTVLDAHCYYIDYKFNNLEDSKLLEVVKEVYNITIKHMRKNK